MGGFAVTEAVVVVGPRGVRGPGAVDPDIVSVAMDCVDERLTVHDGAIVAVRALWGRLAHDLCAGHATTVRLVVPTGWPAARVEFVEQTLLGVCEQVVVARRAAALLGEARAVVEIGPDCALVVHRDGEHAVVPRIRRDDLVVDDVIAALRGAIAVVLDAPEDVAGAPELAAALERRLRVARTEVSVACEADLDASSRTSPPGVDPLRRIDLPRAAVAVGAAAALALLAGAAVAARSPSHDGPLVDPRWVVEGRVAVRLPAHWSVQRVTSGTGSARLQANSPDGSFAIHVTAARVSETETLMTAAEDLHELLDRQPHGVFANFTTARPVADRAAITYSETRGANVVDWAVVVERGVRIAVGCQQPGAGPRSRLTTMPECDDAIRSARAVP